MLDAPELQGRSQASPAELAQADVYALGLLLTYMLIGRPEPAHLDPPPNLIAATLFDGLFQAPALLFVMIGLVRLRAWLRPLGLFYSGAAITNMFFYFTQTFLGPHPPPNTFYYLVFNLPWLIAPMILAARILLGKDLPSMSNARGT